jgi:hypothetical protein
MPGLDVRRGDQSWRCIESPDSELNWPRFFFRAAYWLQVFPLLRGASGNWEDLCVRKQKIGWRKRGDIKVRGKQGWCLLI